MLVPRRLVSNRRLRLRTVGSDANHFFSRAARGFYISLTLFHGRPLQFNGEYRCDVIIGRKQRDSRALLDCLRGSPRWFSNLAVPKLYQNPMQLALRGLLRASSRFPEIVENIEKRGQRMESLECPNALAKQELCIELMER